MTTRKASRQKRRFTRIAVPLGMLGIGILLGLWWIRAQHRSETEKQVLTYTRGKVGWGRIESLGVDALPYLVEEFQVKDSSSSQVYRWIWERLPSNLAEKASTPSRHNWVRKRAVEGVGRLGEKAIPALPALLDILKDPAQDVRIQALESLTKVAPKSRKVVHAIKDSIENPVPAFEVAYMATDINGRTVAAKEVKRNSRNYRYLIEAAVALAETDKRHSPYASEVLMEMVQDEQAPLDRRTDALMALRKVDSQQLSRNVQTAVDLFIKKATNSIPSSSFVYFMGRFGPEATEAAPYILNIIQDPELEDLHINAVNAIGDIDPPKERTFTVLSSLVDHKSRHVKKNAVLTLKDMDLPRERLLPILLKFAEDSDPYVGAVAAPYIEKIAPEEAPRVMNNLSEALESVDKWTVREAAHAAAFIGPGASEVLPLLWKKFRAFNDKPNMKLELLKAIAQISQIPEPRLTSALKTLAAHSDERIRKEAKQTLEQIHQPKSAE